MISDQQERELKKWRSRQVMSVAMGNLAALTLLVGFGMNLPVLGYLGVIWFLGCLLFLLYGGYRASQSVRE